MGINQNELTARAKRLRTVLDSLDDIGDGLELVGGQLTILGQPDALDAERDIRKDLAFLVLLANNECHSIVRELSRSSDLELRDLEGDETKKRYARRSAMMAGVGGAL